MFTKDSKSAEPKTVATNFASESLGTARKNYSHSSQIQSTDLS